MSLHIDFASLAEGVAGDARGSLTLVAVNPHLLIADQLPAQFTPFLVVVVEDDDTENPVIVPGRTVTGRIEALGPDSETLFVAQLRQPVVPPPSPSMRPRVQIIAQIPFTASKVGEYRVSASIAIVGDGEEVKSEVVATRRVKVSESTALTPPTT